MAFALGSKAIGGGYKLAAYDTIGSTSTEARERARQGEAGPLWIVAREQTVGHGRRGRPWVTSSGNLAASLLLTAHGSQAQAATLGFAAGLALHSAIRAVAPDVAVSRIKLKWPNDVLFDDAKVAGILLQALSSPGGAGSIVIGIGVNVLTAPVGLPYPAASLAESGVATTAEALFKALAESWLERKATWDEGRGFAAMRGAWLEHAAGLGSPIAVNIGTEAHSGIFETIDADGRLVVRAADGAAHPIAAGDVHFGGAATSAVA